MYKVPNDKRRICCNNIQSSGASDLPTMPLSRHVVQDYQTLGLSLKAHPHMSELLRDDYVDIIPGFYMDKAHWNSVYLDGEVPEDLLRRLIDISYGLVLSKLTKKVQKEIAGQ